MDPESRGTSCNSREFVKTTDFAESAKKRDMIITQASTRLPQGHQKPRLPVTSPTRTNRACELRMNVVKRPRQNETSCTIQGSVFRGTSPQEGNEASPKGIHSKRQSTSRNAVGAVKNSPHSTTAMSTPLCSPRLSCPSKSKVYPRGESHPNETDSQSLMLSPSKEHHGEAYVTRIWQSKPAVESAAEVGSRGEHHGDTPHLVSDRQPTHQKQRQYRRHNHIVPGQLANLSSVSTGETLPADAWKDPNVIQVNCLSKCDSKVQLNQSPDSDRQEVAQIHLNDNKEEDCPMMATIQQPVVIKTVPTQSVFKRTGDKATDTNADDFSPYTSPSLSMEDEVVEMSSSPVASMSVPKTRNAAVKSLAVSSQPTLSSRQRPPLFQDQQRRYFERALANTVLSPMQNDQTKPVGGWGGRDLIRAFFGCLKTKLSCDNGDQQEDRATRSPYSGIDTTSRDPSVTEDRRTPKPVTTNALSESETTRCYTAEQQPTSFATRTTTGTSSGSGSSPQTEPPQKQARTGSQSNYPTAIRVHVNADRGHRRVLRDKVVSRTPRSLTRMNKRVIELVTQQHHGVKVVHNEFTTFRNCLTELSTQISTMTQTLTEQQEALKQLTKVVESREGAQGGDGVEWKLPERPCRIRKSLSSGHPKSRPHRGHADVVEIPITSMPAAVTLAAADRRSTHYRQPARHGSIPSGQTSERKKLSFEDRPSSAISLKDSTQQPSPRSRCKLLFRGGASSEDYTVVTENHLKQLCDPHSSNKLHSACYPSKDRNNAASIRKPSFLNTKGGEQNNRYFSEPPVTALQHHPHLGPAESNNAAAATATDVICRSQRTISSSSEPTQPTMIEGNDTHLNLKNSALQRYYRIAYVEQDAASSQDALYRSQRSIQTLVSAEELLPYQFASRNEPPRVKQGGALKEARLVATEFVPCPQTDPEGRHTSNMIDSLSRTKHTEDLGNSEIKLASKTIHVPNRTPRSHKSHHHIDRSEQPAVQPPNPAKHSTSSCRRRISDVNQVDAEKVSDSHVTRSTRHRTAVVHPLSRACNQNVDTVLYPGGSHRTGPPALTSQDRTSRLKADEKGPIKSGCTRPHPSCPKQYHQSAAARHIQMYGTNRSDLMAQSHKPNRLRRHEMMEDKRKCSTHRHIVSDRNNNSQDWGPAEQTGPESVCLGKTKEETLAHVSFDQLHKKPDLELHFITAGLPTGIETNRSKPMSYALPGPDEEQKKVSVIEQHLSARRERQRAEQEKQLWDELRTLSANRCARKSGEASESNKQHSQSVQKPQTKHVSQSEQQQSVQSPAEKAPEEPPKQMTALERCREQRRRRLEEKAQQDMQQILALTEKAVLERRACALRRNYRNSEQVSELLNDKPEVTDRTGDDESELPKPQERQRTERVKEDQLESRVSADQTPLESGDDVPTNAAESKEPVVAQSKEYGVQTTSCEANPGPQAAPRTIQTMWTDQQPCTLPWNPNALPMPMYGYYPLPWALPPFYTPNWMIPRPISCYLSPVCDSVRCISCPNLGRMCSACESHDICATPTSSSVSTSSTQTGYDDSDDWTTGSSDQHSITNQAVFTPPRSTAPRTVRFDRTPVACAQTPHRITLQIPHHSSMDSLTRRRIAMEAKHQVSPFAAYSYDPRMWSALNQPDQNFINNPVCLDNQTRIRTVRFQNDGKLDKPVHTRKSRMNYS